MKLVHTPEGHLLIWECGTMRYTLGYRITRTVKRFYARRWIIAARSLLGAFRPLANDRGREAQAKRPL